MIFHKDFGIYYVRNNLLRNSADTLSYQNQKKKKINIPELNKKSSYDLIKLDEIVWNFEFLHLSDLLAIILLSQIAQPEM